MPRDAAHAGSALWAACSLALRPCVGLVMCWRGQPTRQRSNQPPACGLYCSRFPAACDVKAGIVELMFAYGVLAYLRGSANVTQMSPPCTAAGQQVPRVECGPPPLALQPLTQAHAVQVAAQVHRALSMIRTALAFGTLHHLSSFLPGRS
jgi:hypothetical protein